MNRSTLFLALAAAVALTCCARAQAEQHRATRLGNPATRFAPPITTTDELRSRFRDEQLKLDMASVLRQWGWQGNLDDLFSAALREPVADVKIPVGWTMPFMSSRENGKPICLRNVLWAGREPAPAYAFYFSSKGQRYRCVTPKACSNFFLEDLGPEPKAALALDCAAPGDILAGQPLGICLTVKNTGNVPEAKATVALTVPDGAKVVRTTEDGVATDTGVTWNISDLPRAATKQVCAYLAVRQPGVLSFQATAHGSAAQPVQTACSTKVAGVPAILLEVIDAEDPIEVGKEVTYEIRVTNQGSAPGTGIQIVCQLPTSEEFVSGGGVTPVQAQSGVITTERLSELAPKAAASWHVVVKAVQADDARFRVKLTSDQFQQSIDEEESTQLY